MQADRNFPPFSLLSLRTVQVPSRQWAANCCISQSYVRGQDFVCRLGLSLRAIRAWSVAHYFQQSVFCHPPNRHLPKSWAAHHKNNQCIKNTFSSLAICIIGKDDNHKKYQPYSGKVWTVLHFPSTKVGYIIVAGNVCSCSKQNPIEPNEVVHKQTQESMMINIPNKGQERCFVSDPVEVRSHTSLCFTNTAVCLGSWHIR